MAKSIKIPDDRGSRITVWINGVEYVYAAGDTVTVPDEVAAAIADMLAMDPSGVRETALEEELAGVSGEVGNLEGEVNGLKARVTALDDATDGAVPALDTRLTLLDDADTGIVPDHEARIQALEEEEETEPTT